MLDSFLEAARSGDITMMKQLLEQDRTLHNQQADNGETPLLAALYHGKMEAVEFLLSLDIHLTLHEAAAIGDDAYVSAWLDEQPELLHTYSHDGWTPLHLAAFFGGDEAIALLLERGADVNAVSRNRMENRPIHAAAAGRKNGVIHLLLEKGADPNVKQHGGWTALHQAVQNADADLVRMLLDYGADPKAANALGQTPLSMAAELELAEIRTLLEQH